MKIKITEHYNHCDLPDFGDIFDVTDISEDLFANGVIYWITYGGLELPVHSLSCEVIE